MGEKPGIDETMHAGAVGLLLDLVDEYGQLQSAVTAALLAGLQTEADRDVEAASTVREAVRVEMERAYRVVLAAGNYVDEARIGGSRMRAEERRILLARAVRDWREGGRA